MNFKYKKMFQTISLFLVLCMSNVIAFAAINDNPAQPEDVLLAGVLIVTKSQAVKVNGNPAQDGMTILSGSEISTGENSTALIDMPQLGKVELGSETSVKVVFMTEHVEVQMLSGQAKLTTYKGVIGFLTNVDGKFLKTDPKLETSTVANGEYAVVDTPPAIGPAIASPGLFGMGVWGTVASVSGVIGGTVAAVGAISSAGSSEENPISRVRP